MSIAQLKEFISRAETLAEAKAAGKTVLMHAHPSDLSTAHSTPENFLAALQNGYRFTVVEPKKRRPWTRKEAERHVGLVLVSPKDERAVFNDCSFAKIRWPHGTDVTFAQLASEGWQVHIPGQPDNLKPAYVEE